MVKVRIFLILILLSSLLAAQESRGIRLEWSETSGATSYELELLQNNLPWTVVQTQETFIEIPLPPGEYQYQIRVIDKLGNQGAESGWKSLRVERIQRPLLRNPPQNSLYRTDPFLQELEIFHFLNEGRIYLIKEKQVVDIEWKKVSADQYSLRIPSDSLEPGDYTLVLENSSDYLSRFPGYLQVLATLEPELKSLTPSEGEKKRLVSDIVLVGENLIPELDLRLYRNDKELEILHQQYISGQEIRFWLNLNEAEPGMYHLEASTPWGKSVEKKRIFNVSYKEGKSDYYNRNNWGIDWVFGYNGLIVDPGNQQYDLLVAVETQLRMDLALKGYVLRNMGLVLAGEWIYADREEDLHVISGRIGIYYRTRRKGNINLYGAFLLGTDFVSYLEGSSSDTIFPNGPSMTFEGAAPIQIRKIIVEPALTLHHWYLPNGKLTWLRPSLRLGYRF